AREYFIKEVLLKFLPSSVVVGSGEITDGDNRSGQQDIILYRADFPVIKGFNDVNLYLIEGTIATIEVKSDLTTGQPNGLSSAFSNLAKVSLLKNQAIQLTGSESDFHQLQKLCSVKTFVVGYKGWKNKEALLENFRIAGNNTKWNVPDIVYQPGYCIANNMRIDIFHQGENETILQTPQFALCSEYCFALFIQSLFKAIMVANQSLIATAPNVNATMHYPLNNYFSLPYIQCQPLNFTG
ncbi:MAG TPA: DUF6602 domain-containing protein, partial [Longilinea sp.]|nr:DUF6602 domain-containing protein [Longilinea sp.]